MCKLRGVGANGSSVGKQEGLGDPVRELRSLLGDKWPFVSCVKRKGDVTRSVFWEGHSGYGEDSGQDGDGLDTRRPRRRPWTWSTRERTSLSQGRGSEAGKEVREVRVVYSKWMNIYFKKTLFWKYSKCETCDHSDILIAYVTREGVAASSMMGSCESSQNHSKALSAQTTWESPPSLCWAQAPA